MAEDSWLQKHSGATLGKATEKVENGKDEETSVNINTTKKKDEDDVTVESIKEAQKARNLQVYFDIHVGCSVIGLLIDNQEKCPTCLSAMANVSSHEEIAAFHVVEAIEETNPSVIPAISCLYDVTTADKYDVTINAIRPRGRLVTSFNLINRRT